MISYWPASNIQNKHTVFSFAKGIINNVWADILNLVIEYLNYILIFHCLTDLHVICSKLDDFIQGAGRMGKLHIHSDFVFQHPFDPPLSPLLLYMVISVTCACFSKKNLLRICANTPHSPHPATIHIDMDDGDGSDGRESNYAY